LVLIKAVSN